MGLNENLNELALFGGKKAVEFEFKRYNPIGIEEVAAAKEVIETGVLSKFLGAWSEDFYGGIKVKEFEKDAANYFGVKHAVTVNSWTSGLIAAIGAIGIEPGDEVIVSPWTMCASATSILHWNAIPVFADIEDKTFNLDPESVEKNISENTKAILAVDIFGLSSNMEQIMSIARKYNLKVVTDSAQSPGTKYKGLNTGTLGDVGGYSLNYHKHIHTGEGGILVTNNDEIADRLRLIRNHAEAVVAGMGIKNIINMVGYNFRLGEIECAIGIEQLKKLDGLLHRRQKIAEMLTEKLTSLTGLRLPTVPHGQTHAYYMYPMVLDVDGLGVSREKIITALQAEGVTGLVGGYANLHLLPIFQEKIAYGSKGFPWTSDICKREVSYQKGICPIAESLQDKTYMGFSICLYDLSQADIECITLAFQKVWKNLHLLQ